MLTASMQRALLELSAHFEADPAAVYRHVLAAVAAAYPGAAALIVTGDLDRPCVREVVNPHPALTRFAPFAPWCDDGSEGVRGDEVVLIHDLSADPRSARHGTVAAGFVCYLGVPLFDPSRRPAGTLCFLGREAERPLGDADVAFLSLLGARVSVELERERLLARRKVGEEALIERLEAMNAQLRRADEEKRRFVMTLIHDLRQPLTAMRTTLYLLRGEMNPRARDDALAMVENRLAAIQSLVEELGEYSRMEAGQVPWKVERVDLGALLASTLDNFAVEAAARCVRVRPDIHPTLGEADTDARKLRHVVANLLSNAIKFSARESEEGQPAAVRPAGAARVGDGPQWGTVWVRAQPVEGERWRLEIADDGVGMPADVQGRVFEEFYQGPEARASELRAGYAPGLGVGLAIVGHYGAAMGAEIAVESRPGAGARFTLTFPRRCPAIPAVEPAPK